MYRHGAYYPWEYGGYGSPHLGAADAEVVLTIPNSRYGGPYAPGPYAPYGVGQYPYDAEVLLTIPNSQYGGPYDPGPYAPYGVGYYPYDAEVLLTIPNSQYGGPYAPGPYAPYGVGALFTHHGYRPSPGTFY